MCGIVGYIGKKEAREVLIEGLKKLEYRGYDSSGMALVSDSIQILKSIGKVRQLEKKVKQNSICSTLGIAHTRWATHGEVNEVNAHPHQNGNVTLVHNGIIENADELREELQELGVSFYSHTDTEVIAALLNYYYSGDALFAINKMMGKLVGSYALGILFADQKDKVYAVKMASPLVVGVGEEENFFASDVTAIHNQTEEFYFLDDYDIAEISRNKIQFFHQGKVISKRKVVIPKEVERRSNESYEHFMLKEIYEQPELLDKMIKKYANHMELLPDLSEFEEIHIVACGSAMYAGMIGKELLEEYADVDVLIDVASEYRYKKHRYARKTLVIGISQSGETADTIAALKLAKESNIPILAIVNKENSTIHKLADQSILLEAGEEVAVATTKAYLLQVAILSLLSLKTSFSKNILSDFEIYKKQLLEIPNLLKSVLKETKQYQKIAEEIKDSKNIFFLGRKLDYAMCLEGSLKLKEVSYLHSEAYQAGELKHGTISLVEKDFPVIVLMTDSEIYKKTLSNAIEVKSRGAKVIPIVSSDLTSSDSLEIVVPATCAFFQPLLVVPVFQLIAYYTALYNHCDIDQPKNLAKSVTVE